MGSVKKEIRSETYTQDGETLRILGDSEKGCFVEILRASKNQLDAMLSHHCRVLVIRYDLHTYEYEPANQKVSMFIRRLRKKLKQMYGLKRVGFIWAREIEKAKSQHYHLVLILDGNKVRYPCKVKEAVESCWMALGEPKPFTPDNCYYDVRRGDTGAYNRAFKRISYLAKSRGKGYKSDTANDYSASRIKNNETALEG